MPWTVSAASYLDRSKRRSTIAWARRRSGPNNAATSRVEPGDRDRLPLGERAEDHAQDERGHREDHGQHGGDRRVADGPADQPVDVVQAVAQDRDADRDRNERPGEPEDDQPGLRWLVR